MAAVGARLRAVAHQLKLRGAPAQPGGAPALLLEIESALGSVGGSMGWAPRSAGAIASGRCIVVCDSVEVVVDVACSMSLVW